MGQGHKGQSRHQQITKNRETLTGVTQVIEQITKTMAKDGSNIDKRFKVHGEELMKALVKIEKLEHELAYRALPFWKRWLYTWQVAREQSKERAVSAEAAAKERIRMSKEPDPPAPAPTTKGDPDDTKTLPQAFTDKMVRPDSHSQEDVKKGEHNDEAN